MAPMADEPAFAEFVVARTPALMRTAYLLTRDHHLAEDLVQTALFKAAMQWERIEGEPEPYVRRILYTENISRWRRRRHLLETPWTPADPADVDPDVDLRVSLERALDQLTAKQRTVLVLRYAALRDAGAPGIALSPDGTRLAYSWHARRPAPGDTWIPSGARVVDLDSGRLHTGPGRGPSGEGRLAWNFSWSPDGRYLAYATAADDSGFTQRDWFPPSEHGYELLDTTTYRPVDAGPGSQDTEGRPLPVAVSSTGTVFRNGNGQNLVARAGGRDHRRVATFGWRSAHINPSGDWLAAGDDDGISMVLERAVGRPSGSVVTVLPRREVASGSLVLLAWPTPTRLVAVRHRQVGPSSFSEDADLVRLTLNIDADDDAWVRDFPRIPRARMEIVGRVTGAEPGTVLSFATGLAAGDPPTREFEPPPFADGHDQPAAGGPTERSAGPTDEAATVPLRTVLLAVTLVALAAAAALLRAARRRVPGT